MRPSFRNRVQFLKQNIFEADDPALAEPPPIQNIIYRTDDEEKKWIEKSTEMIGDFRSVFRSVYMRWAITINSLFVARDRYQSHPNLGLRVDTVRASADGPERVELALWHGQEASRNYEACIPLMGGYGVQDMYGALEEVVFELYEIYLDAHPQELMKGDDFKRLRKLYRDRETSPEAATKHQEAWSERLDSWRRKRAYDGLHKVFAAYFKKAGLKRPSWYTQSDIGSWAKAIETVGLIRHHVTHGEDLVSEELGRLCAEQPQLGLDLKAGEQLVIYTEHLMLVEAFFDQLLTAINISLLEKGHGKPLPKPES
ncbi:hypothetical protein MWU38_09530 [Qipengyuania sp. S6317L1]|nr:hypothetical protein [Qipengyuania sp. S6317L1]